MKTLKNSGFRVRAIVSDNHSANVLAYELPLKGFGHLDDNLFIDHDYQKIKNVRNNLLNYKRFIFPAFEYDGFKDTILFKGGQTSSKLYHVVLKKIAHLRLTGKKAPKLLWKYFTQVTKSKTLQLLLQFFMNLT